MTYRLSHLDALASEAIHIIREVVAEFERPALLFSGGKDSAVLLHLAAKACWPQRIPFPVVHVDTGHNFPEVIDYRDNQVAELDVRLVVGSVQEDIDRGSIVEQPVPGATRNRLQTFTLLRVLEENRYDAVFGGGRRDEEKARAKERVFSLRDEFGQWDPRAQRPELWNLYNTRHRPGEHFRVFPLSNWTELDIWQYVEEQQLALPPIYFAHRRDRLPAHRHAARGRAVDIAPGRRRRGAAVRGDRALPHRRRHDLYVARAITGRDAGRGDSGDGTDESE